jgi:hypothetical protein
VSFRKFNKKGRLEKTLSILSITANTLSTSQVLSPGFPTFSVLSLRFQNKKDVIGSAWAEHDKLKITEEQLQTWHESIDQTYIVKCNRAVLKSLHNAIYPTGKANTKANQRLQQILGTKTNGKVAFGKFLAYKCGLNFFSNSRSSRI